MTNSDFAIARTSATPNYPTLRPGRFARLQPHEKCLHCGKPRVRGMEVCVNHGGGKVTVQRARDVLANPRTGQPAKERSARRLAKLERNRVRAYREDRASMTGPKEAETSEAMREVREAIRTGTMTLDFVNRAVVTASKLRPYRESEVRLAGALYARAVAAGVRREGFDAFCSALSLDEFERNIAEALLSC